MFVQKIRTYNVVEIDGNLDGITLTRIKYVRLINVDVADKKYILTKNTKMSFFRKSAKLT